MNDETTKSEQPASKREGGSGSACNDLLSGLSVSVIADRFGLTLCAACEQPREIHAGYDHGKRRCLIDTTGMMLRLDGRRTKKEKADLIERLNAFFRAVGDAEEAELVIGAGI